MGIAALEVLEEGKLEDNAERLGKIFRDEVGRIRCTKMVLVRGKGLLNAVVFEKGFEAWSVCLALARRGPPGQADPRQHHPLRPAPRHHREGAPGGYRDHPLGSGEDLSEAPAARPSAEWTS
ncbi:MAG: hypothetical protein MZV70_06045 [Desulfobacterales bacterium]|nr:hypothetical protein [Desulfobacterales bacterium]